MSSLQTQPVFACPALASLCVSLSNRAINQDKCQAVLARRQEDKGTT